MRPYIELLRPHQFVKNLFVFLPVFFAREATNADKLLDTALAFVAFCCAAGAVYVFNDWRDCEDDKLHPLKKLRPLASGEVKSGPALALMAAMLGIALALSLLTVPDLLPVLAAYLVFNLAYSMGVKQIAIVDVMIVALGFVLRLLGGALAADVNLSKWIIIVTFLGALFIALAKRRDDQVIYSQTGAKTRKSVDGYNVEFLNISMVIMAAVLIVAYIMYTVSDRAVLVSGSENTYITAFFVLLGIMRYLQITLVKQASGAPSRIVLRDRFLQLTVLGWLLTFTWILYVD